MTNKTVMHQVGFLLKVLYHAFNCTAFVLVQTILITRLHYFLHFKNTQIGLIGFKDNFPKVSLAMQSGGNSACAMNCH